MAKKSLGRGLNAILSDVEEAYKKDLEEGQNSRILEIDIDRISPNPYQPRTHFNEEALEELSQSIKRHGLLQPIIVIEKNDDYVLIAGERRLRASKLAGLETITAIVADLESQNLRELALIENIQREDLNPIELAQSYKQLIEEYDITQEELSNIVHKSRAQITNTIRLLSLVPSIQQMIQDGKISQGHSKVLVGLSPEDQKMLADSIVGQKLSVRETENLVKNLKSDKNISNEKKREMIQLSNLALLEQEMSQKGFQMRVKNNAVTIKFESENEVNEFLKLLKK